MTPAQLALVARSLAEALTGPTPPTLGVGRLVCIVWPAPGPRLQPCCVVGHLVSQAGASLEQVLLEARTIPGATTGFKTLCDLLGLTAQERQDQRSQLRNVLRRHVQELNELNDKPSPDRLWALSQTLLSLSAALEALS
jgi:hypothetical protein